MTPAIRDAQVAALQGELIHLLRGDTAHFNAQRALAILNGDIDAQGVIKEQPGFARIKELRARILALNPKACVFETWGGPMPPQPVERRASEFGDLSNRPHAKGHHDA